MADRFDTATRSRIMRAVKSRDTKPELKLAAELERLGVPFARPEGRGAGRLPGSPDIMVAGSLAVFVHGCFWHKCPVHYREPKSRSEHWRAHISKNVARDRRVRQQLRKMSFMTMVVWEHEDMSRAARRVAVRSARCRPVT